MSENAIDSENASKPAPEAAKPKGARRPTKKAKAAKKAHLGHDFREPGYLFEDILAGRADALLTLRYSK